jgi:nitrate/nitrite transporter NarK
MLPESPSDAHWLRPQDRELLQQRLTEERDRDATSDPYAGMPERARVMQALKSGVAWYFSAIYFLMILGFWAIPYWLPQIIGSRFATTSVVSGYLSAIPWAVVLVAILLVNWSSRRTGETRWHIVCCLAAAAVGLWVSSATESGVLAIAALAVAGAGMQSAGSLFYHYQVGAFRGIMVAVVLAMVNAVGNIGGFIGPFVFGYLKDIMGSDVVGLRALAGVFLVAALLALGLEKTVTRTSAGMSGADRN